VTALRRAFLAVVPPPSVRTWTESVTESATESARALGAGLRWTRSEQRHLTVKFLGPVPDLDPRADAFAQSFLPIPPFSLSLGGGGAFPDPRRASVLWIGVREGSDALAALAARVAEPDDRPYRGHVTLARTKRARDVRAVVAALDAHAPSPAWTVDEVVLFDSAPSDEKGRRDGAVHTEQARFRLAG
jgi:RNA 2',3'-cyclic 3'-phosphodiesterase